MRRPGLDLVGDTLVVQGRPGLGEYCEALLADARTANARELGTTTALRVEGMLAPDGDLETSGASAARGYALLSVDKWPDVFVILATSHHGPPAIGLCDVHTPLGRVRSYRGFADALRARARIALAADAPELVAEPSWQQQLPLLQTAARAVGREPRIVALLVDRRERDAARALARAIGEVAFSRAELACVIASGDPSALIEHASCPGRVLAGSLVFARGMPIDGRPGRPGACDDLLVRRDRDGVVVIHRCTLASHALPAAAWPVVEALWRGARLDDADREPFITRLAEAGIVHDRDLPSTRAPASVAARLAADHERAPFTTADQLRGAAIPATGRARLIVRYSSASSGRAPLQTAVEREVNDRRALVELLVQPELGRARVAQINRPTNLELAAADGRWPAVRVRGERMQITPGPNPSAVAPDVWSRVLAHLVRFDPEQLEGDPPYLAALAHACLASRVVLPRVRAVLVGHGHAWLAHRAAIRAAFGREPIVRYHSSELGPIAIACDLGRLHLLDRHAYYEVVDRGRQAAPGSLGALVATTLDTQIRPLVRYVLGDVVRIAAPACACGKPFRIVEYAGRFSDLVARPRGEPITTAELDAAIGAPSGVQLFQLVVGARRATLAVTPADARMYADVTGPRDRLEALLRRPVRVRAVAAVAVASGGKLLALRSAGGAARWYPRFLSV